MSVFGLTAFDLILIIVISLSCLYGTFRGFFSEILSLLTWILAFYATFNLDLILYPYLFSFIETEIVRLWVLRLSITVLALLAGNIVKRLLVRMVKTNFPGNVFFGLVFGLLRALVLIAFIIIILQDTAIYYQPWIQESIFLDQAKNISDFFKYIFLKNI